MPQYLLQVTAMPRGWGPQPIDDMVSTWIQKAYQSGDLRPMVILESGGPVVCERYKTKERKNASGVVQDRHEGDFDVLLVTCWCEKAVVKVEPDDVRQGLTYPCHRAKCRVKAWEVNLGPEAQALSWRRTTSS